MADMTRLISPEEQKASKYPLDKNERSTRNLQKFQYPVNFKNCMKKPK